MKQFGSIQVLRAVAALMIVFSHAQDDALNEAGKAGIAFLRCDAMPWPAGVDLFFVISGFIMVHASGRLFATPGAAGAFIGRRLIRIVPLYWLATAITLAILAATASSGKQPFPSLLEIATSFGFVPFTRPGDGAPRPIAALGWTLNYEMAFYCLFACCIRLPRARAVAVVSVALAVAVGVGALLHPQQTALAYWSDPIVLEFAIGMGLAMAWHHGIRLPQWAVPPLLAAGVILLAFDLAGMSTVATFAVDPNGFARLAFCGLPMALVFASIVLAKPAPDASGGSASAVAAVAARLGDASYALYLFHPFVIVAARKAYLSLGLAAPFGFWPLVLADLPLAAIAALAIHLVIERPITGLLQARLRPGADTRGVRAPAPAAISL